MHISQAVIPFAQYILYRCRYRVVTTRSSVMPCIPVPRALSEAAEILPTRCDSEARVIGERLSSWGRSMAVASAKKVTSLGKVQSRQTECCYFKKFPVVEELSQFHKIEGRNNPPAPRNEQALLLRDAEALTWGCTQNLL